MSSLAESKWLTRFLDETPGDTEVGGKSRQVPNACWSRVDPFNPPNPKLELWSDNLGDILNLTRGDGNILGGGKTTDGMDPYAQRYGGHQFGNWAGQLGDGRAITLGELALNEMIHELQLKGSGRTPYSRFADGKAVLRSSIREFLCSEAMHSLGVPTTRALSLVTTGEEVLRDMMYNGNPELERGAVVCRVSPSFIRFGSFQIHSATGDVSTLKKLVEHTVRHHYPGHSTEDDKGLTDWLSEVAKHTALMISHWMRVGFVHGVMNTDNMSIHGLTIDYGPYGWLEDYNPNWTPNTTDASTRRYRFAQQPKIGAWNLARLLESMVPLMDEPEMLYEVLDTYTKAFDQHHNTMWANKLGFDSFEEGDEELVTELNRLLQLCECDMTIFFRLLCAIKKPTIEELDYAFYNTESIAISEWNAWLEKWWTRVNGQPNRSLMLKTNPKYVLRNWMAQLAIDAAENEDFSICEELQELLMKPYDEQHHFESKWFQKRPEWARTKVGCSMLSCSS